MNAPARVRMSLDQYLDWESRQERKHELVDGVIKLMTGGTAAHNAVAVNVIMALGQRSRGTPCRPFGSDLKVRIPNGNIRYPDVTIDCGKPKPSDLWAAEPRVIFEVLSRFAEWFDQTQKLEEYKSIPSVAHIVFLSQTRVFGRVWTRSGDDWASADVEGAEGRLRLPAIETEFPLGEAYESVEFEAPEE